MRKASKAALGTALFLVGLVLVGVGGASAVGLGPLSSSSITSCPAGEIYIGGYNGYPSADEAHPGCVPYSTMASQGTEVPLSQWLQIQLASPAYQGLQVGQFSRLSNQYGCGDYPLPAGSGCSKTVTLYTLAYCPTAAPIMTQYGTTCNGPSALYNLGDGDGSQSLVWIWNGLYVDMTCWVYPFICGSSATSTQTGSAPPSTTTTTHTATATSTPTVTTTTITVTLTITASGQVTQTTVTNVKYEASIPSSQSATIPRVPLTVDYAVAAFGAILAALGFAVRRQYS